MRICPENVYIIHCTHKSANPPPSGRSLSLSVVHSLSLSLSPEAYFFHPQRRTFPLTRTHKEHHGHGLLLLLPFFFFLLFRNIRRINNVQVTSCRNPLEMSGEMWEEEWLAAGSYTRSGVRTLGKSNAARLTG